LLEPVGRRIQIETLANKTLAVGAHSRAQTLVAPRPPAWPCTRLASLDCTRPCYACGRTASPADTTDACVGPPHRCLHLARPVHQGTSPRIFKELCRRHMHTAPRPKGRRRDPLPQALIPHTEHGPGLCRQAMRDERGDLVRNAHLLGFFRRICRRAPSRPSQTRGFSCSFPEQPYYGPKGIMIMNETRYLTHT
jgi:hypothetical protein